MKKRNIALIIMWIIISGFLVIGSVISQKQIKVGNLELNERTLDGINKLAIDNGWNQVTIIDMETGKRANLYEIDSDNK